MPVSDEEAQVLRDRIEELEHLLGMKERKPRQLEGIRELGWRLLGLLYRRGVVTREEAFTALYGGRSEAEQPANLRIIDVNIGRLRKPLKNWGILISVERDIGYYLDKVSRERLGQLLEREE